jgi:hypothetical protein
MPIIVTVNPMDRMVLAIASGKVTLRDFAECLLQLLSGDLQRHRKIIELVNGTPAFSKDELFIFAELVRDARVHGPRGAMAIVADSKWNAITHAFADMAGADRHVRVCPSIHDARGWLASEKVSPLGVTLKG